MEKKPEMTESRTRGKKGWETGTVEVLPPAGSEDINVFEEFARCAGLGVIPGSIEKREPPEPDIRCEIQGEGPVAFELTESIDGEHVAKPYADAETLREAIEKEFKALPCQTAADLRRRLGDAIVHVEFDPARTLREKRAIIPSLLESLRAVPADFEGTAQRSDFSLPEGVLSLIIKRCGSGLFSGEPHFDVDAGGAFADRTPERIEAKLAKTYQTDAPIELLVHFGTMPVLPEELWLPAVRRLFRDGSYFRRIWIFDRKTERVVYRWPETLTS